MEINPVALIAAVSAGVAASCMLMLFIDLLTRLQLEREEGYANGGSLPLVFRVCMPLVPNVRKLVSGASFEAGREKGERKLQMAGYDQALSGADFLSIKLIYAISGAVMLLLLILQSRGGRGLLLFVLLAAYPEVWIRTRIQRRHLEIMKSLPNLLDLLTMSVEAGRDFMTALRDILRRRRRDALGEELERTFHEIQLGKPRAEALRELGKRVSLPDLSAVLNAIIQAEELGVSIAQLLKIQGDLLRNKRFSRAEKLANEAPVKILGPMVLFIFPSVFIILMGPILLQVMKTLFR